MSARLIRKVVLCGVAVAAVLATVALSTSATAVAPAVVSSPIQRSTSWLRTPANFAHAMGGLTVGGDVYTYTNTLEAFEQNWAKGYRIFEVDLILTADKRLVARHDWSPSLYADLGEHYPGHVPTHAEFMATKVFGKYTPLDIEHIVALMRSHPDMYIVTDTKFTDSSRVRAQFGAVIKAMGKDAPTLSQRVIVQIYGESMLSRVRSVYRFKNIIYTLYRQDLRSSVNTRAIQFAHANGIRAITIDTSRYSPSLARQIRAAGIAPAVNTIDSSGQAADMYSAGVRYLYSDTLPGHPSDGSSTAALITPHLAPNAVPFDPHDD
jgi:glycerophosphoryl diester phosphodiesterase